MIRHRTDCKRGLDGALFCCMNKFGGLMTGEDKLRFGKGFDIINSACAKFAHTADKSTVKNKSCIIRFKGEKNES